MAPPHTDDNLVTKLERLHELLLRWTTVMAHRFVLHDLPAAATSCAKFSLTVDNTRNDVVSIAETTTALAEYLRVLDLVARAGFCPAVLRRMFRFNRPFKGCSFHDWCEFCSGEDRVIALKLTWFGSLKALETALFDWDDSKGRPDFHAIRRIIGGMENTRGYDDTTPQLVHLALKPQNTHTFGSTIQQELRDLLARYKDAESRDELQLCRFTRLSVGDLEDASIESVIQSGLEVATNDTFGHWQWVIRAPTSTGATWSPSSTPLARGNVTSLRVKVSHATEEEKTECDRLHEVLRLQPTRLKKLYIEYGTGMENGATCNELSRMIGDSLFSWQSALRLDQLVIVGHLSRVDVVLMLDRLKPQPASRPLRELVLKGWGARVGGNGNGKGIKLGTTLAALVRQIGGVQSLRIEPIGGGNTNLLPADVLPLTICRELDVSVDAFTWETLAPPTDDQSALPADAQLERLVLRLSSHWDAEAIAAQAIRRVLEHVGSRLRSLSILPQSLSFSIDQETATAVVELCPNLETLHVQYVDDSFGDAFADALSTSECCRLERLSLRCRHSLASMFSLVSTLRQSTHPLSRSLRSLRLYMVGMGKTNESGDDMKLGEQRFERGPAQLVCNVFSMLAGNKRLRSVSIRVYRIRYLDGLNVRSLIDQAGSVVALPPLRHRLAMLSVLHRYNLPQDPLIDMMMMTGHHVARLQFTIHNSLEY